MSSNTTNISNLRVSELAEIPVPIMPLQMQAVLVQHLNVAGRLRRLRRIALEMSEAFLGAVFLEMFGDPIENSLGLPLENLGTVCKKVIDYRGRTPDYSLDGIPHVTAACIKKGLVEWNACKYVSDETFKEYMTRGLPEYGDVLFTTEAPLGESAVVLTDKRFSLAQRIVLLRAREFLDPNYLSFLLGLAEFRPALLKYATGTTVKGISSENLQGVPIPIPSFGLQQRFANLAAQHQRAIRVNREAVRQSEHLFQTLLHEAFGG
jgi:type I restriction enzyme S subunit